MAEKVQQELDVIPVRTWLHQRVTDEELIQILMDEENLDSTLNVYKKRTEEWKKKL